VPGYVVARGRRFYAVVYDGIDPITGRERRQWHAAGADRATPSGWRTSSRPT